VFAPVLGSLDLAHEFGSVAAHALGGDFDELDHAVGIDHEGAAVGQANAFAQDAEVVRDGVVLVAQHVVVDLADGRRAVSPGLVAEVGVGRHRVDFDAQTLEFFVAVGEVFEFGRAHEGEVGRVEEEHGPLAENVSIADINELALDIGSGLERLERGSDDRHGFDFLVVGRCETEWGETEPDKTEPVENRVEVSGGPALRRRLRFLLKWSYALATIFANDQFRPE
jgi:hypothetical protein